MVELAIKFLGIRLAERYNTAYRGKNGLLAPEVALLSSHGTGNPEAYSTMPLFGLQSPFSDAVTSRVYLQWP